MRNDNRTPHLEPEQPHLYAVLKDMKQNIDQVRKYKDAVSRITFGVISEADNADYYAEDVFFIDKVYELLCLIEEAAEEETKQTTKQITD